MQTFQSGASVRPSSVFLGALVELKRAEEVQKVLQLYFSVEVLGCSSYGQ